MSVSDIRCNFRPVDRLPTTLSHFQLRIGVTRFHRHDLLRLFREYKHLVYQVRAPESDALTACIFRGTRFFSGAVWSTTTNTFEFLPDEPTATYLYDRFPYDPMDVNLFDHLRFQPSKADGFYAGQTEIPLDAFDDVPSYVPDSEEDSEDSSSFEDGSDLEDSSEEDFKFAGVRGARPELVATFMRRTRTVRGFL
jgi:hypothetical protein